MFYRCRSAVLGLHIEENQIIGSAFDQLIYTIDPRDGVINKKKYHRGPILCLSVDENYIVSGSEDKTIAIFDRRAGMVYKTIKVWQLFVKIKLWQLLVGRMEL